MNRRPSPFTIKKPRSVPPSETGQEAAFLRLLGQNKALVTIRLVSGETLEGWIEYYDEKMVRLTREDAPNLFIYKEQIAYIIATTEAEKTEQF